MARDVVEIAKLLTSELVTNRADPWRRLDRGWGRTVTEVPACLSRRRRSHVATAPRHINRQHRRSRGLMLVESFATRWGVTQRAHGKKMWFELRTA